MVLRALAYSLLASFSFSTKIINDRAFPLLSSLPSKKILEIIFVVSSVKSRLSKPSSARPGSSIYVDIDITFCSKINETLEFSRTG